MPPDATDSNEFRPQAPPSRLYDGEDSVNRCFVCENPRYALHVRSDRFGFPLTFQRCACGLVKQTPMPGKQFFEWFFNSDLFLSSAQSGSERIWGFYDYLKDEPCRLSTSRYRYRRLRKLFPPDSPLRILKIGPATGSFLGVALQQGDEASGCDISSRFVTFAAERYGARIDVGRFEDLQYPDGHFDLILMLNVIENLPNPEEVLREIHRTLKPGGMLAVNFVDMRRNMLAKLQKEKYFLFRPPVTYMYTKGVLVRALQKHGFRVEHDFADWRFMHLEKILTLLDWRRLHAFARWLRVTNVPFPVYAYPSRLLVGARA